MSRKFNMQKAMSASLPSPETTAVKSTPIHAFKGVWVGGMCYCAVSKVGTRLEQEQPPEAGCTILWGGLQGHLLSPGVCGHG